jgi:hypothetical protein
MSTPTSGSRATRPLSRTNPSIDQLAQLRRQAQQSGTYYPTSNGVGGVAANAPCLPANSAGKGRPGVGCRFADGVVAGEKAPVIHPVALGGPGCRAVREGSIKWAAVGC